MAKNLNREPKSTPPTARSMKKATERKVTGGGTQSTTSAHAKNRTALNQKAHGK